eukprot:scaffold115284_cov58-Phaeocystis_antarctica.AAC.2
MLRLARREIEKYKVDPGVPATGAGKSVNSRRRLVILCKLQNISRGGRSPSARGYRPEISTALSIYRPVDSHRPRRRRAHCPPTPQLARGLPTGVSPPRPPPRGA